MQRLGLRSRKSAGIAIFLLAFAASGVAIYSQCHLDTSDSVALSSHHIHQSSPAGNPDGTISNSLLLNSCIGVSFIVLFFVGKHFKNRRTSIVGWSRATIPIRLKIKIPPIGFVLNIPLHQMGVMRI